MSAAVYFKSFLAEMTTIAKVAAAAPVVAGPAGQQADHHVRKIRAALAASVAAVVLAALAAAAFVAVAFVAVVVEALGAAEPDADKLTKHTDQIHKPLRS